MVAIQLFITPLLVWGASTLLGMSGQVQTAVVLEAGMPSMMLTLVVGERFGLDTDFIASAIFVTTAASALTLPLVQFVAFR